MKVNRFVVVFVVFILLISLGFNFYFLTLKNNIFQNKKSLSNSKVIKIIDGDTLDIQSGDRIRLYEIDAPEYPTGCLAEESKERLENLILNREIKYKSFGKDNFGRIIAYVYYNNLSVNELLVEEGLAYFQKGKILTSDSLALEKLEEKANTTQRGVWSSLCQTKKDGCLIKGNYRPADNTRIYHTTDCYNYDRITIKPGTSDCWFCTEEEAQKAGFKKSQDCPK